jgi:hypothetical protein
MGAERYWGVIFLPDIFLPARSGGVVVFGYDDRYTPVCSDEQPCAEPVSEADVGGRTPLAVSGAMGRRHRSLSSFGGIHA